MRTTRLILAMAWLACGGTLAACTSGGDQHPAGSAGVTSASPDRQTTAIVACYRSNGDPGFPDPVYDPGDGRWHFAISPATAPERTRQACQHLFPATSASPPVPQAQFTKLVRLAECIRQHGVPAWPDPAPDGGFPLPPPLLRKTPAYEAAAKACQRDFPSSGIDVYAAP